MFHVKHWRIQVSRTKKRSTFRRHGGSPAVKTSASRKQTQSMNRMMKSVMRSLMMLKRKGDS